MSRICNICNERPINRHTWKSRDCSESYISICFNYEKLCEIDRFYKQAVREKPVARVYLIVEEVDFYNCIHSRHSLSTECPSHRICHCSSRYFLTVHFFDHHYTLHYKAHYKEQIRNGGNNKTKYWGKIYSKFIQIILQYFYNYLHYFITLFYHYFTIILILFDYFINFILILLIFAAVISVAWYRLFDMITLQNDSSCIVHVVLTSL